jgi:hypothetical protein
MRNSSIYKIGIFFAVLYIIGINFAGSDILNIAILLSETLIDLAYSPDMDWHVELPFTTELVITALLGAIIGLERERHVGLAGIRTHAAVALRACLFGFISFNITGPSDPNRVVGLTDLSRIAAQIVSGIGFLGAGVIL